jgi:hypothetical protein
MWNTVAKEMNLPWRAVELMHWQMGPEDLAKRANDSPHSCTGAQHPRKRTDTESGAGNTHSSPMQHEYTTQSQGLHYMHHSHTRDDSGGSSDASSVGSERELKLSPQPTLEVAPPSQPADVRPCSAADISPSPQNPLSIQRSRPSSDAEISYPKPLRWIHVKTKGKRM